jgi:uncharacterized protein (TIGR02452 family)
MSGFDFAFTPSLDISRAKAAAEGREAVTIIREGSYLAPAGRVDVAQAIAQAVAETRDYPPAVLVAQPSAPGPHPTAFTVVNGTSLAAAQRMAQSGGEPPMVLNFASARNPGGGFLGGARAQEESLARASALYATIEHSPMYPHHRHEVRDCLYTDWMIHSPRVPIFRDSAGALLDAPYACAFITAPAPNAGVVLGRAPERREEVRAAMARRVGRMLAIAAHHGHSRLVLGAWGCGVFKNDPAHVAACFAAELHGPFAGVFREVVFAVLDWSEERRFVRPFVEHFGNCQGPQK